AVNNARSVLLDSPAASYGKLSLADISDPTKPKLTDVPVVLAGFGPNGPTAVLSDGLAVGGGTAGSPRAVALARGGARTDSAAKPPTDELKDCQKALFENFPIFPEAGPVGTEKEALIHLDDAISHLDRPGGVGPVDSAAALNEVRAFLNLLVQGAFSE